MLTIDELMLVFHCEGTENGSIGVLDVYEQNYQTILRSHYFTVHDIAIHPSTKKYNQSTLNHFASASSDGSIRIWNRETMEQLHEFRAPEVRFSHFNFYQLILFPKPTGITTLPLLPSSEKLRSVWLRLWLRSNL